MSRRFGWTVDNLIEVEIVTADGNVPRASRIEEILSVYRMFATEAPRELSVFLILMHAPPAPFVPEEWHGKRICAMAVCYSGDLERTDAVLAPIRAVGDPIVDLLQPMPYTY